MSHRLLVFLATAVLPGVLIWQSYPVTASGSRRAGSAPHQAAIGKACVRSGWRIETGIDPGARKIKLKTSRWTTVAALSSVRPHSRLLNHRLRPMETTVWAVRAVVFRYRREADGADVLRLRDDAGHTITVSFPSLSCVPRSSRSLTAIKHARRVFESHYHPARQWKWTKKPVAIRGVGYFVRAQSGGKADNRFELNPGLTIAFRTPLSPTTRPIPQPSATPTATPTPTQTPVPTSTPRPTATPMPAATPRPTVVATPTDTVPSPARMCGVLRTPPVTYKHVIWIWMENRSYGAIVGANTGAPYINGTLIPQCGLATNCHSITHPALPNYLAATAGQVQANAQWRDCKPAACPQTDVSLFEQLQDAGKSWREYAEGMPVNCYTSYTSDYLVLVTPAPYFTRIASQC